MMGLSLPEMEVFAVLASTGLCPALPAPEIVVSIQRHDAELRNDLSMEELRALRADMDLTYQLHAAPDAKIAGLLQGDIGIQYAINLDQMRYDASGRFCARYQKIHVAFELRPVIYVAGEYAPPACLYREIYQHEEGHITVDQAVVEKYAQRLRDGLAMTFSLPGDSVAGPVPLSALPALKNDMGDAVIGMTNVLLVDMARERAERQSKIDAPENYRAVMRRCYLDVVPRR